MNFQQLRLMLFAAGSYAIAGMGGWAAANSGSGVPPESELSEAGGTIGDVYPGEYIIKFTLPPHPHAFGYNKKGGDGADVEVALMKGRSSAATVLFEPTLVEPLNQRSFRNVHQITINGATVRSYGDVKDAYIADDGIGLWLCIGFLISGTYLGWYAVARTGTRRS